MNVMKRHFLTSLIGATLSIGALAACGSSTGGTGGGTSSSGTTTATGSTTATGTGTTTGTTTGSSMSTGTGTGGAGGNAGQPTISFTVNPSTMHAGDTIEADVTVTNFTLVAPSGQPNKPGEGHYHIYLDQQTSYLVAGQTPTVMVKIPANTQPGAHTLRIDLTDNHHKPLSPAVGDEIPITVQ